MRQRIIEKHTNKHEELRCYICGKPLSLAEDNVEIEHIFPKAMGGITQDINLQVSCKDCNKIKNEYIDSTDFHYEEICLINEKSDNSFQRALRGEYRIAICAKSQYSCSICRKQALEVGRLDFGRINLSDSWHFLNIDAYCQEHTPE